MKSANEPIRTLASLSEMYATITTLPSASKQKASPPMSEPKMTKPSKCSKSA